MKIAFLFCCMILMISCKDHSGESPKTSETIYSDTESSGSFNYLENMKDITFSFKHSLRIPYREVEITISAKDDDAKVHLKCDPMSYDEKKWTSKPLDTTYSIPKEEYDSICETLESIPFQRLMQKFTMNGIDGNTCTLTYGTWQNSIGLTIWSPNYDTQDRELTQFLNACELILESARLNPKEIF